MFRRRHKEIFNIEYSYTLNKKTYTIAPLPYSRNWLRSQSDGGLRALDDLEFCEDGWISLFNMMIAKDLTSYSFN